MNRIAWSKLWICAALPLWAASLSASQWPQWRGPYRTGHAPEDDILIHALPSEPKVVWKIKAGPGLASPVLNEDLVIQFEAEAGKETLHALDRKNGNLLWSAPIDKTFHDNQGPDGPRCTPVMDGDRVYAVSCRGYLQCVSLKDGKKLWGTNYSDMGAVFIGEKGNAPGASRHGNNGTPLVSGERLYACVGGMQGAGVVCFEKLTGRVIWKSQDDQAGFAPPMLIPLAGKDQLVCFTAEGLIGLNPQRGDLWWRVPVKTAYSRHVVTPVWHDDVVVISSHQAGLIGTRVSAQSDSFKAEQAWVSKGSAMNFSSPVSEGDYLYGLGPRKNFICVQISTGKEIWSREGYIQTSADRAYAGFLIIGKNVLCLTDGGMLVMFEAIPKAFVEHGAVQVCGANWCNPAYADGLLFLRDGNRKDGKLMCLDLRSPSTSAGQ
jgi:hypothetical protein